MNAQALLKHMATGSTGSVRQIGLRVGSGSHNLARYMRELAADGLVEQHGSVRMPGSQRDAAVWRITDKGRARAAEVIQPGFVMVKLTGDGRPAK